MPFYMVVAGSLKPANPPHLARNLASFVRAFVFVLQLTVRRSADSVRIEDQWATRFLVDEQKTVVFSESSLLVLSEGFLLDDRVETFADVGIEDSGDEIHVL